MSENLKECSCQIFSGDSPCAVHKYVMGSGKKNKGKNYCGCPNCLTENCPNSIDKEAVRRTAEEIWSIKLNHMQPNANTIQSIIEKHLS